MDGCCRKINDKVNMEFVFYSFQCNNRILPNPLPQRFNYVCHSHFYLLFSRLFLEFPGLRRQLFAVCLAMPLALATDFHSPPTSAEVMMLFGLFAYPLLVWTSFGLYLNSTETRASEIKWSDDGSRWWGPIVEII